MLGIVLGVVAVLLGAKAFKPEGLPLTRTRNLTGTGAKILGAACILLGGLLIVEGALGGLLIALFRRPR